MLPNYQPTCYYAKFRSKLLQYVILFDKIIIIIIIIIKNNIVIIIGWNN